MCPAAAHAADSWPGLFAGPGPALALAPLGPFWHVGAELSPALRRTALHACCDGLPSLFSTCARPSTMAMSCACIALRIPPSKRCAPSFARVQRGWSSMGPPLFFGPFCSLPQGCGRPSWLFAQAVSSHRLVSKYTFCGLYFEPFKVISTRNFLRSLWVSPAVPQQFLS